jgi:hypothetical protein
MQDMILIKRYLFKMFKNKCGAYYILFIKTVHKQLHQQKDWHDNAPLLGVFNFLICVPQGAI